MFIKLEICDGHNTEVVQTGKDGMKWRKRDGKKWIHNFGGLGAFCY